MPFSEKEKSLKESQSVRELAVSVFVYSGSSIFGPLIVFGSLGYFLDKYFDKKPLFLVISIIVSFIATNIFVYKKMNMLIKKFDNLNNKDNNKNKEEKIEEKK